MSEFLQFLDGLDKPQEVLIIFTVNNIEKLDEVITRKGRIDQKFNFEGGLENGLKPLIDGGLPLIENKPDYILLDMNDIFT